MKRASTLLSWWYLAVGGALTAACLAAGPQRVHVVLYSVAVVGLLTAIGWCWRRGVVTPPIALLSAAAALSFAASRLLPGDDHSSANATAVTAGVAAYTLVGLALFVLLRRRGVAPGDGLLGDALIVGLGAWVISWTALMQPILDQEGLSAATLLHVLHQPLASTVLFLALVLQFDHRNRFAATWLLTAALTLQVLADLVDDLIDAGHLAGGFERLAMPLGLAAMVAAGACFLHPTLAHLGRTQPTGDSSNSPRLVLVIGSLLFPVIVLAASTPVDTVDKVVRSVSAIGLGVAVTARVLQTLRSHAAARSALLHGVQTDPLTGLPNRAVMLQEINVLLGRSWGHQQQPTIYYVDLDRFKNINDSLGHSAGDEVLQTVAQRLRQSVPQGATVARFSSDEYVILDPNPTSKDAALVFADELLNLLREPLALSHGDVFVTASIGVAAISGTSTKPEELVRHADTAMYSAKEKGRNRIEPYDESMRERARERLEMETALHRAIDRNELCLHHQPIVDLATGRVSGFEALMRWQREDGSLVSPVEFIPIAEETGMIMPLGKWALLEALNQLREWTKSGVCGPNTTMSVNVSTPQLADPGFPAAVAEALSRSGVPASSLWLEVTESVMMKEPETSLATLRKLRALGVCLALDDFGTGYSSLSLLQQFPLQRVKIDKAFVRGVAENPADRSLVKTIIVMAQTLGLDVVAEGVETIAQMHTLQQLDCQKAQGFLISRPVPAEAVRTTVAALERPGTFPVMQAPVPGITSSSRN